MPRSPQRLPAAVRARPLPPAALLDPDNWRTEFVPGPDVSDWLASTFLDESSPLYNDEHAHLRDVRIHALWTSVPWTRQMNRVAGMAEIVMIRASAWTKGRQEQQFREWFGEVPQFLITLDARYAAQASDAQWCALIEHELYHFGHQLDDYGNPAFKADGSPKIAMRSHDVEEFVGIVRRYGAGNAAGATAKLVSAAALAPEIAAVDIACMCGTCHLRVA